jgi:hypothetical protein
VGILRKERRFFDFTWQDILHSSPTLYELNNFSERPVQGEKRRRDLREQACGKKQKDEYTLTSVWMHMKSKGSKGKTPKTSSSIQPPKRSHVFIKSHTHMEHSAINIVLMEDLECPISKI